PICNLSFAFRREKPARDCIAKILPNHPAFESAMIRASLFQVREMPSGFRGPIVFQPRSVRAVAFSVQKSRTDLSPFSDFTQLKRPNAKLLRYTTRRVRESGRRARFSQLITARRPFRGVGALRCQNATRFCRPA